MDMIEINNRTKIRVNKLFIQRILKQSLNFLKKRMDISVAVVSPQEIKRLNRIYRRINRITDVLAFEELNEIIICYQQAKKQAKMMGYSIEQEIKVLLTHGLLHLLGYDHQTKKQKKKMDKLMAKLLSIPNSF